MKKTIQGALIASAVASMFAAHAFAGDAPAVDKAAKVKCAGTNGCKGKGECAGADNTCAGQNGCKGKGINMMSAKDCKAKKGTVVADKK